MISKQLVITQCIHQGVARHWIRSLHNFETYDPNACFDFLKEPGLGSHMACFFEESIKPVKKVLKKLQHKCGICGKPGHNKTTCPSKVGK